MASIENRSHYQVTVKNRDDLTKTFAHNAKKAAEDYCGSLKAQKLKPRLARLDNCYVVRDRSASRKNQSLPAASAAEAKDIKNKLEIEHKQSVFTDYATGYQTTLAELLTRYLHEESPRHKSFEIEGYKINALLQDAGLERQDLAAILAAHPNPHTKVAGMKIRKSTGTRVGQCSEASKFIRKPFAQICPDDFKDYIDERCQEVSPATVDREIDIFSAVCRMAIDTWRIHVEKNPMDGVRRPRYYNERDRRLKGNEEERLLCAAYDEDRVRSINMRLGQLMSDERQESESATTVYRRKQVVKRARQHYLQGAEDTYEHTPLLETFVQFQLMTGARRSETLTLTWANVDLEEKTAFLPETKNGRSRKVPLRSALVNILRQLPRTSEHVFPISVDGLRKAWMRICKEANLTEENDLHIHDLRHEAISRVAEAGSNTPGGFTLVDLQNFSGHRDTRMLLRYAHLCTKSLAQRLDAAFASTEESLVHHGRRRLRHGASVTIRELANESATRSTGAPNVAPTERQLMTPSNVIHVSFARIAA